MSQLELLMDYTIFHIGVYTTLVAVVAGTDAFKNIGHWSLRVAVVGFLIAGAAGGIIASSIPDYPNWEAFVSASLGPWGYGWFRYQTWARIEHGAFWIGVLFPTAVFVVYGARPFLEQANRALKRTH